MKKAERFADISLRVYAGCMFLMIILNRFNDYNMYPLWEIIIVQTLLLFFCIATLFTDKNKYIKIFWFIIFLISTLAFI